MPDEITRVLGTTNPRGSGRPSIVGHPTVFYLNCEGRGLHHDLSPMHLNWAIWKDKKTDGRLTLEESESHVNYLELMGAFLALQCFVRDLRNVVILVRLDNRTAIAHINKMGVQHCPSYADLP